MEQLDNNELVMKGTKNMNKVNLEPYVMSNFILFFEKMDNFELFDQTV